MQDSQKVVNAGKASGEKKPVVVRIFHFWRLMVIVPTLSRAGGLIAGRREQRREGLLIAVRIGNKNFSSSVLLKHGFTTNKDAWNAFWTWKLPASLPKGE